METDCSLANIVVQPLGKLDGATPWLYPCKAMLRLRTEILYKTIVIAGVSEGGHVPPTPPLNSLLSS